MYEHAPCASDVQCRLRCLVSDTDLVFAHHPHQSAETEHPGPGRREPATTRRMGAHDTNHTAPDAPHPVHMLLALGKTILLSFARARATLACHSKAATHHGKLATHTRHKHARRAWPFLMSDTAAVYIRDHIV